MRPINLCRVRDAPHGSAYLWEAPPPVPYEYRSGLLRIVYHTALTACPLALICHAQYTYLFPPSPPTVRCFVWPAGGRAAVPGAEVGAAEATAGGRV